MTASRKSKLARSVKATVSNALTSEYKDSCTSGFSASSQKRYVNVVLVVSDPAKMRLLISSSISESVMEPFSRLVASTSLLRRSFSLGERPW
jgi:hypothetical protein